MENKEINELVKIVGLQYKKKYESVDDLKSLRYGKVMIISLTAPSTPTTTEPS